MIDVMTLSDAEAAAALSAQLGWPHRPADWTWFLQLGHGTAWRVDGALLGTAMTLPLDDAHATIGLVQVSPDLQGRGIGRQLTQAAMAARGGRNLMLHATAAGAGLYAKLGFEPRGVVRQWQGTVQRTGTPLRPATGADFAAIASLDHAATGLARTPLLRAALDTGVTHVAGGQNEVKGYATRRQFGRGALIGPVVAQHEAEATALVESLLQPGFLRIDLAQHGAALTGTLQQAGLACVDEVQVMVHGSWPDPPGPPIRYALVRQALG